MPEEVAAERLYVQIVADASGFRRDLQDKVAAATRTVRARVKVGVTADVTGFRRDLKTKADAAAAKTRVKIAAELDSRRLGVQTRTAARDAGKDVSVKIKTELDSRRLGVETRNAARDAGKDVSVKVKAELDARRFAVDVRKAAREAAQDVTVKIKAELDARRFMIDVRKAAREAAQGVTVKIKAELDARRLGVDARKAAREASTNVRFGADTLPMRAQIAAAKAAAARQSATIRVKADTSPFAQALKAAGRALISAGLVGTVSSGILVAAGAATDLASALFQVAAAASQAVGVMGALPGLASAAAQGIGAAILGFSGISKAVNYMQTVDKNAAYTAGKSATAQVNSADQIAAAQQRLADARKQAAQSVADAERTAAKNVANAEDAYKQSLIAEKKAQVDLTAAREQARQELQQLAFDAKDAALAEQQAEIDLEHARLKLEQTRQSATASPLEKRQAELDYQKALLDLAEAKAKAAELEKQNKAAQKAGVKGTDTYKQAEQALAAAKAATAKAEKNLAEARRAGAEAVAKAQAAGARQIAAAQRAVQQAMKSSTAAAGGSTYALRNLNYAMAQLSPAGQRFVNFMVSKLLPRFNQLRGAVQTALLPPLQTAITRALPLLDTMQPYLVRTGALFGQLALQASKVAASPMFRKDIGTIMGANNVALGHFGRAAGYLADALKNIMVVTAPLTVRIAKLTENWSKAADQATRNGRESGKMAAYFDRSWNTAAKLFHILRDVSISILNIGKAASPSGNTLLDSLARGAAELRKWTADPKNQEKMQRFFERVVPLTQKFGQLLDHLVQTLIRLGNATGGNSLDPLFKVLNTFLDLVDAIAKAPGGGTILSGILLLSSAGLGLGFVARFLGKILGNIQKLNKYTGVSRLLSMLTGGRVGGRKKSKLGDLADDAAKMGTEIDKELPKDKKKSDALDGVGGAAGKAKAPVEDLSGGVKTLGKDAEEGAAKSGKLATFFGRFSGVLKRVLGPLGKVALLLTQIPGLGKVASGIGGLFKKIKLPGLSVGGEGGALSGLRGFFGGVGRFISGQASSLASRAGSVWRALRSALTDFKPPALTRVLSRVGSWFKGLGAGIGKLSGGLFKGGGKGLLGRVGIGAAEGGAKGSEGGPIGIVGGILAGITGQLIGGGHGGVRGAIGGGISGAATGAGAGALVGSIVPGIGNVVGAVVGGLVGAVVGAITGGKWWGKIGRFFSRTLPDAIVGEAKKLPGQVARALKTIVGIQDAIGGWLLDGLKKVPGVLGRGLKNMIKSALDLVFKDIPSAIGAGLRTIPAAILNILLTGVEKALHIAFKIPNAFGWLLNAALAVAPKVAKFFIGLPFVILRAIQTGVRRAPAAFSWLGKQASSIGRRLPHLILTGIKSLPRLLTGALLGPIGALFSGAWRRISSGATAGLHNVNAVIKRHLGNIGADFRKQSRQFVIYMAAAWGRCADGARRILNGAVTWVRRHLGSIRSAFSSARNYVAGRASSAFSSVVSSAKNTLHGAVNWVSRHLKSIRSYFSTSRSDVGSIAKSAFTNVANYASSLLDRARRDVSSLLSKIVGSFSSAKTSIGKVWSGLGGVVRAPVDWIGYNVYNRGIKHVWDMVAAKVKMGPLPPYTGFATGGILPGYTPGRDVMTMPGFAFSGGEAIMRPEWTRAVGPQLIELWNRLARTGGAKAVQQALAGGLSMMRGGFARGGILPVVEPVAGFADGGILGAITSGWSKFANAAKGLWSGGLKQAADWVLQPILKAVGAAMAPTGQWGQMLAQLPPEMVSAFVDYLVKNIESKLGGDPHGVVAQAKQFIGIGDDRGPNNNMWTRAWGMPGAPWCAMFVSDMIKRAKAEKFYSGYPTALAAGYDSMQHVGTGRAGDLATYNNGGHINIIEKPASSGGYWTIGGNQNALVQRGVRSPQVILRPTGGYALGGLIPQVAKKLFLYEAPRQIDRHELQTPMVQFMRGLPQSMIAKIADVIVKNKLQVAGPHDTVLHRDRGGRVPPGRHTIINGTGRDEWVITGPTVDLLGGPQAIAALNAGAAHLYRTSRTLSRPAAADPRPAAKTEATVNVFPQPRQSEHEIGVVAARKLGAMLT